MLGAKMNMFSPKTVVKTSGKIMTRFPYTAFLGRGASSVKFHAGPSRLHGMKARRAVTQIKALNGKSSLQRDVMDMHRLLCHALEGMVRDLLRWQA